MSGPAAPVLGAIAVVCRDGEVILVQRGKAPRQGMWGFPGGHVELGETALDAAVRELREETGVEAVARRYLNNIDVIVRSEDGVVQTHYLLAAVLCDYVSGEPVAADDAASAGWFAVETLEDSGLALLDQVIATARLALEQSR